MPTYVYETERFEFSQSMRDKALTHHPETGQPIRRIVTGGFELMKVRSRGFHPRLPHSDHASGCCPGCHD